MEPSHDLDAAVRRSDPDRWLAARFIVDVQARADVIALYALNDELSRIHETVREPLMGEIRLAWWREALDEIFAGGAVRRHRVVEALAEAVRRRGLARAPFDAMIEARYADLEAQPFGDDAALEAYIDGTAGALMALAIAVLAQADGLIARSAARAWALAGLWRRQGLRDEAWLPVGWDAARVRSEVAKALQDARAALTGLPVAAFPAVAYTALAGCYAARREVSALETRLRLTGAVLTGRV